MKPDIRADRAELREAIQALKLPQADDSQLRRKLMTASADDLSGILQEAHRLNADRNTRLREKYAGVLAEARAGFLEDSGIAIQIAEDGRALKDRERTRHDPEAVRADAIRLRTQGAGLDELQRTLHTTREQISEWIKDAPQKLSAPVSAPVMDPRDQMPDPRPVIPSKRLKKWTPDPLAEDDPRHGTSNGYSNWGCRCEPCRAAFTAYKKSRRTNPVGRVAEAEHGTRSKYSRGCRCDECKAAATEYARELRDRNS